MAYIADTFLQEVATKVAQTVGTTIGGNAAYRVFISKIPDSHRDAIVVIPTSGVGFDPDNPVKVPTTQITVRSANYLTGLTYATTIYGALNNKVNVLNTYRTMVNPSSLFTGAYYLDEKNLYNFPLNFMWKIIWAE
jgi:hypothetical protein